MLGDDRVNICKNLYNILYRYRSMSEYSIRYEEAKEMLNNNAILVDVRSKQEYREGHLDKSINIPLFDIERGNYNIPDKNTIIVLYCQWGKRSNKAMQILRKDGYLNVYQLAGGIDNI